jgi:hypothetical protein
MESKACFGLSKPRFGPQFSQSPTHLKHTHFDWGLINLANQPFWKNVMVKKMLHRQNNNGLEK